jgi:tetratricopeptide (TPR) repeat protein
MTRKKQDHKHRLDARRQREESGQDTLLIDPSELAEPEEPRGRVPGDFVDMRRYERGLTRMRRYLAQHGIEPSDEREAEITEIIGDGSWLREPAPDTAPPLERAQELIFDAWEIEDPDERLDLAEEALELSEDCADAWVILAEEAPSIDEARKLYRKGVTAGKRALGGAVPTEPIDNHWELLPVLPWIRARQGVAATDRTLGEPGKAATIYQELLAIDTRDIANSRIPASGALFEAGRDDELLALIERFDDGSFFYWSWLRALVTFRKEGDGEAAGEALDRAVERQPWVPVYLLGVRRLGNDMLVDVDRAPEAAEAGTYVMVALTQWLRVPGAIEWVRRHAGDAARATAGRGRAT